MKKYLLFIITTLLILISLSSCDTSDIVSDEHIYNEYISTEGGHCAQCECGAKTEVVPHIMSDAVIVKQKESCSQEGIYEYHCVFCDYKITETKPKLPHKFGEWQPSISATCITNGQLKRVCEVCGQEEYMETDKLEHTPAYGEELASTCTHEGHTSGIYCDFCHKELEAPTSLPLASHSYTKEEVTLEPTLNNKGTKKITCANCKDYITEELNRLPLTDEIYLNSLTEESLEGKIVEFDYINKLSNKNYTITLKNKNNKFFASIYDKAIDKITDYYTDKQITLQTSLDGYSHASYDERDDIYLKYVNILLSSINNTKSLASNLEYNETTHTYFINNALTRSYQTTEEEASITFKINDDESLESYSYISDTVEIKTTLIDNSSTIIFPHDNSHTINDEGICEYCHEEFSVFKATKGNFNLTYYTNINDPSIIEFSYSLIDDTQDDVTFLKPSRYVSSSNNIIRYTSQYYEGTSPIRDKKVKEFTINDHMILIITFEDDTQEMVLLKRDNSCHRVYSTTAYSGQAYDENPIGQTFELLLDGQLSKYYLKSETELIISDYIEINTYNINDNVKITDFNSRDLEMALSMYFTDDTGTRHDNTSGKIVFSIRKTLAMQLFYGDIFTNEPFSAIKVTNITGKPNNFTVYFMGDNENYALIYNGDTTVVKL